VFVKGNLFYFLRIGEAKKRKAIKLQRLGENINPFGVLANIAFLITYNW
jgi:hypothetical protein